MSHDAAERLVAGRWTLHTALRRGPAGVIWRATDADGRVAGRRGAAPPRPPDPAGGQADLWDRVAAEARAAASLTHPGLVALEDVVVEGGVVYVASELVEHRPDPGRAGGQARARCRSAGSPSSASSCGTPWRRSTAAGLAHLDLRPGNVLVTADGRARLAGVGLATLRRDLGAGSDGASRLPRVAPEQVQG
jgi:serine/threonine protein kinase